MIVISIAHALNHPGAQNERLGLSEYTFSLVLSSIVVNMLNMKNVCKAVLVDCSNIESYNEILRTKIARVNSYNPKLALELHFNSSVHPAAAGYETLYLSSTGKKYAELIQARLGEMKDLKRDRGTKKRDNLMFLKATTCPALILEPLFLSNPAEGILLKNEKFISDLANKIFLGCKDIIES